MIETGHPFLKMKLDGVSEDINRQDVAENLIDTMRLENGVGLAANQVGLLERIFVMYSDIKEKKIIACFNPHIIEYATEEIVMDEGCLSYPGLWLKIKRPVWIKATWEDQNLYSSYLKDLVQQFQDNFKKFSVRQEIVEAGPSI